MTTRISRINVFPNEHGRDAFALIELLAAVTILMIIVGMMVLVFTEAERCWTIGTGRAENNSIGRAALTAMAHDLQYAVTDSNITFVMRQDRNGLTAYGFENDEICFVSLQHDSSGSARRTAREVHYYLREDSKRPGTYQLRKGYFSKDIHDESDNSPADGYPDYKSHSYWNRTWYETGGTSAESGAGNPGRPSAGGYLADNAASLAFFARDSSGMISRDYFSDDPANSNRLPEYVDVFLEILNKRDAIRAAGMSGAAQKAFVDRNARRYTTRVYFQNRQGYRNP